MSKKKIIEAVLLSLTIAYAVTKAIANFQCNDELESSDEDWNFDFSDSS